MLSDVKGVGEVYAGKLREAGITTTGDLLLRAGTRSGRGMLAASSGIPERLLGEWVGECDRLRTEDARLKDDG
jgi:hypothetical protein